MTKETHEWLRALLPVLVMAGAIYLGQAQQVAVISEKVDTLTSVIRDTNSKMDVISDKVISNDKEVSFQTYVIKNMDERLTKLEDNRGH